MWSGLRSLAGWKIITVVDREFWADGIRHSSERKHERDRG